MDAHGKKLCTVGFAHTGAKHRAWLKARHCAQLLLCMARRNNATRGLAARLGQRHSPAFNLWCTMGLHTNGWSYGSLGSRPGCRLGRGTNPIVHGRRPCAVLIGHFKGFFFSLVYKKYFSETFAFSEAD